MNQCLCSEDETTDKGWSLGSAFRFVPATSAVLRRRFLAVCCVACSWNNANVNLKRSVAGEQEAARSLPVAVPLFLPALLFPLTVLLAVLVLTLCNARIALPRNCKPQEHNPPRWLVSRRPRPVRLLLPQILALAPHQLPRHALLPRNWQLLAGDYRVRAGGRRRTGCGPAFVRRSRARVRQTEGGRNGPGSRRGED